MSEHPPQNQNIDKSPKFSKERAPYSAEDESLAHYINDETKGNGASTKHINELIDVANEKIDTKRDLHLENPDNPEGEDSPDLNPGGEAAQEQAAEQARADVNEALNDQEPDAEGDNEEDPGFKGNDDETKLVGGLAENVPQPELAPEESDEEKREREELEKESALVLQKKIETADKIVRSSKRAKALREIAEEHNSIEAARKITKLSGTANPIRFLSFFTGTDRSQHDRAMESISKSATTEFDRLTAAQAIKRGNARNRALEGVLTRMIVDKPNTVLQLSREMHGPSRGKYRKSLVQKFAGQLPSEEAGLDVIKDELRMDGPISHHLKGALYGILKDDKVDLLERTLDKLPSKKRDNAIGELALQYKSSRLLKAIQNPFTRDKFRKKIVN